MAPKRKSAEGTKETKAKKARVEMSAKDFKANAGTTKMTLRVGDQDALEVLDIPARQFSTGSLGFNASAKLSIKVTVDGVEHVLPASATLNIIVTGSKGTAMDDADAEDEADEE